MSKRQDILDAAVGLFVEQGVESTPTAQISKAAGVATGTLFHHFVNKDELVRALVLEIKESLFTAIQEQLADAEGFKGKIEAIWLAHIRWAMAHPLEFRFKTQMDSLVKVDAKTQQELDSMWGELKRFVASGVETGVLKPFPEDYLFRLLDTQVVLAAGYFIDNPAAFRQRKLRGLAFASLWESVSV